MKEGAPKVEKMAIAKVEAIIVSKCMKNVFQGCV